MDKTSNLENISEEELKEDNQDVEIRDKGDWEKDISELTPLRRKEQVDIFKKLPNGLTPYEIMYGKVENDSDYLNKFLD